MITLSILFIHFRFQAEGDIEKDSRRLSVGGWIFCILMGFAIIWHFIVTKSKIYCLCIFAFLLHQFLTLIIL